MISVNSGREMAVSGSAWSSSKSACTCHHPPPAPPDNHLSIDIDENGSCMQIKKVSGGGAVGKSGRRLELVLGDSTGARRESCNPLPCCQSMRPICVLIPCLLRSSADAKVVVLLPLEECAA